MNLLVTQIFQIYRLPTLHDNQFDRILKSNLFGSFRDSIRFKYTIIFEDKQTRKH